MQPARCWDWGCDCWDWVKVRTHPIHLPFDESPMPRFAANLSMLYPELPFMARFEAAARDGFQAVEYLFPYGFAARELAAALKAHSLQQILFNAPPGGTDSPSCAVAWEAGDAPQVGAGGALRAGAGSHQSTGVAVAGGHRSTGGGTPARVQAPGTRNCCCTKCCRRHTPSPGARWHRGHRRSHSRRLP